MNPFSDLCAAAKAEGGGRRWSFVVVREIDSSNLLARRLIEELRAAGDRCIELTIFALEQTAGRGRLGRTWVSAAGLGAYVTIVKIVPAARLELLPMSVPVALVRCLREEHGCGAAIKWPNDITVGGRKLGGILIESLTLDASACAAIIGFGVNHGQTAATLPTPESTSLRLELPDLPSLGSVATRLAGRVLDEIEAGRDAASTAREYSSFSAHAGGERISCRVARVDVQGTFRGFDSREHLRLEIEGRERTIASGEIVE